MDIIIGGAKRWKKAVDPYGSVVEYLKHRKEVIADLAAITSPKKSQVKAKSPKKCNSVEPSGPLTLHT